MMDIEDKKTLLEVIGDLKPADIDDFLVVFRFKNGDTKSYLSEGSVGLFDWISDDIEVNRKIASGEWDIEDVYDYIENKDAEIILNDGDD